MLAARSVTFTKVAFRRVARSTDARTMIASVVPHMPCGDKASVLRTRPADIPALALLLNSVALDALVRLRVGGTQVDYHYARETPLLSPVATRKGAFQVLGLGLNCASPLAAVAWCQAYGFSASTPWKAAWAITDAARLNMRVSADALTALRLGLDDRDLRNILTSCDRSSPAGDVKGFWRVDKDRPAELRQTVLTLVAFAELQSRSDPLGGAGRSLDSSDAEERDEGWFLPESLRLDDYQLGEGEPTRHAQPVTSRLGPRFHDWQLAQSVDESWQECNLHARNLLGLERFRNLAVDALSALVPDRALVRDTEDIDSNTLGMASIADALGALRLMAKVLPADVYAPVVDHLHESGQIDGKSYQTLIVDPARSWRPSEEAVGPGHGDTEARPEPRRHQTSGDADGQGPSPYSGQSRLFE